MHRLITLTKGPARLLEVFRGNGSFFGRVSGDVMRISGAIGLAQILAFAAAPLLTRLYGPEAFGHFSVLGALVNILLPLITLRYNWALPLPKENTAARGILALCLVVTVASSIVVAALGIAAQQMLTGWITVTATDIGLLTAALLVTGLHEVMTGWLVRHQMFQQVASVRFITLLGVVAGQICFAALVPDASSLLLGLIGGYLLGFIRAAHQCRCALLESVRCIDLGRLGRTALEYRRFPLLTTPSSIVSGVSSQVPNLVLPSLYGMAVTGQWSLAQRVLWQPTAFIGQAVSQVFWGNAARLQWENPMRLWLLFVFFNAGLLAVMVPAVVLLWLPGDLFVWIFGPGWEQAGQFAAIIVLSSFVGLAAHGTESLHVYGLNHWMPVWEIFRLVLVGGGLGFAWGLNLSAMGCVVALSLANIVADSSLLALNAVAIRRIRARTGRSDNEEMPTANPTR